MSRKFVYPPLLAIGLFLLGSCNENKQPNAMAPLDLPVSTVQSGNENLVMEYPASIEGVTDVEIRPQVAGYLQKILVDEGSFVRAGQPLFKIDDRIYMEQYNTAAAAINSAKANLTTAKIDLNRRKVLVKENIVSDLQTQQAQATYDAALAALNQAEANAKAAKINYQFCTITAPVSGYLGRIKYRLGSLIGPTSPEAITLLSDVHKVNVYFSMSEPEFLEFQNKNIGATLEEKIRNSAPVELQIANGQMYDLKGKIDAVEGQFNANTGSVSFRVKFENPRNLLRAGNTGKIMITQSYDNATLIPIASTYNIQDKVYIFSIDKNNKAIQIPLEIVGQSGKNYMVKSGIKTGDTYITSGFERLQPGMPVTPLRNGKK